MISTNVMVKLGKVRGNKMVDMQLTNEKLVDRGEKMIVQELDIEYAEAQKLLLIHGSVRKAVDAERKNQSENYLVTLSLKSITFHDL